MNRGLIATIILIGLFILISCYFYSYNVGFAISSKTSEWADFATYFSAIIGFVSFFLIGFLTFLAFDYNKRSANAANEMEILMAKPLIAFPLFREGGHTVENIGNGAEINIVVKKNFDGEIWDEEWLWNSLASKGDIKAIPGSNGNAQILCATYNDSFGNKYISYMKDDFLRVINCKDPKSVKNHTLEFEQSGKKAKATHRK